MHTHSNFEYWQLQDAKARLSELVKSAVNKGPQCISVRGNPEVVVISMQEYEQLTKHKMNLLEFMQNSPLLGIELPLERNKSTDRDIDL